MIKLQLPILGEATPQEQAKHCHLTIMDDIQRSTGDKHKLLSEESVLYERILSYFHNAANPEFIGSSPYITATNTSKLLRSQYTGSTITIDQIKADTISIHKNYCPYCGLLFSETSKIERDHALPQAHYPEYSALSANLIAVCGPCNSDKHDHITNEKGEWLFIHPYFDNELTNRLLNVQIIEKDGIWLPEFSIDSTVESAFSKRLKRHIHTLELFQKYGNSPLSEYTNSIQRCADMWESKNIPLEQIRVLLKKEATRLIHDHPNNPTGLTILALSETHYLNKILDDQLQKRSNID